MRLLPIAIICHLVLCTLGLQAQFTDSFDDGNFTENPPWTGNTDDFIVEANVLRLNAPEEAGERYLSTASAAINDAQWQFEVSMDFNPSGSNYCDVFLVMDAANPAAASGYFVRLGDTPDHVSLYRLDNGAETLLIEGASGTLNADPVLVGVRVSRTDAGEWTLERDVNLSGTFIAEGTATDNTHSQSTFFGLRCTYTATRSTLFFFDNFSVTGDPFTDTTPPALTSVEVLSATAIALNFSEPVQNIAAGQLAVDGGTEVGTVNLSVDNLSAEVGFVAPFTNGTTYNLELTGLTDLAGNEAELQEASFTYFVPETPDPGDVVFNEIMCDPTPLVGLPDLEWVELYNASSKFFDLAGWQYVNSETPVSLPAFVLGPGEYVVLTSSSGAAEMQVFGPTLPLSSFSALVNSGDSLTLLDADGNVLDGVVYDLSWYGDEAKEDGGYTLERINPLVPCATAQNWRASNHPEGGTPATTNSVFSLEGDTEPPAIVNAFYEDNLLQLALSEPLYQPNPAEITLASNPPLEVTGTVLLNGNQVVGVQLATEPDPGVSYTLSLSGAADCSGNAIDANNAISFSYAPPPVAGQVVINELLPDPTPTAGLPEAEFIELHNTLPVPASLGGFHINDLPLPAGTQIAADGFLVLTAVDNVPLFAPGTALATPEGLSTLYLTNGGRTIGLLSPEGDTLDAVSYNLSWYNDVAKADGGWSLERINPFEFCAGAGNWTAAVADSGGTPGATNSVFSLAPDTLAPRVVSLWAEDAQTLRINFSENLLPESLANLMATSSPALPFGQAAILHPGNAIEVPVGEPLTPGIIYALTLAGLTDCAGNVVSQLDALRFALPQAAAPGDVVINELLFDPPTGGNDFVELYNKSSKAISLQGWRLANNGGNNAGEGDLIAVDPVTLLPGEFLCITDNLPRLESDYPQAAGNRLWEADIPPFNTTGGEVALYDSLDALIDYFPYDPDLHFALLTETKGVSLERITPQDTATNRASWTSAAEAAGWATPGFENSQYAPPGTPAGDVSLRNTTLSPDNDGYEDVLQIDYRFNTPDYLITISVLDERGFTRRQLVRNESVGTAGTYAWDGLNDTGERVPVGLYLIVCEVFNPSGDTKLFKLPCVVAARL